MQYVVKCRQGRRPMGTITCNNQEQATKLASLIDGAASMDAEVFLAVPAHKGFAYLPATAVEAIRRGD